MTTTSSHRPTLLAAAAFAMLAGAAQAQTAESQRVEVLARPIVETQRVDPYGALVTDVGEAQVRELNAIDLSSALRRTPGVAVSRFNPVGSFGGDEGGAVYVRGMGASRPGSEIKTYVDGIPFYMGVWNHSLLDLLPIGGMEAHQRPQGAAAASSSATPSPPSTSRRAARGRPGWWPTCGWRPAASRR